MLQGVLQKRGHARLPNEVCRAVRLREGREVGRRRDRGPVRLL
jgi:hypothetical protein